MNIELLRISSDQLEPSGSGLPEDLNNFDILIELDLCFEKHQADSVFFELHVASPQALKDRPINCFSPPTLVLEEFNWDLIKSRVSTLLLHANNSKSWTEVATKLSGYIRPSSLSCFPL